MHVIILECSFPVFTFVLLFISHTIITAFTCILHLNVSIVLFTGVSIHEEGKEIEFHNFMHAIITASLRVLSFVKHL